MVRKMTRRTVARKNVWKLDERGSVVFDVNGRGVITLAPGGARERWKIEFVAVNASTPTTLKVPSMVMYRSAPVSGNQLAGTFTGTMDSSTDEYLLNMNEPVVFEFTGGDPGAVGSVHIEGLRYVWGN